MDVTACFGPSGYSRQVKRVFLLVLGGSVQSGTEGPHLLSSKEMCSQTHTKRSNISYYSLTECPRLITPRFYGGYYSEE